MGRIERYGRHQYVRAAHLIRRVVCRIQRLRPRACASLGPDVPVIGDENREAQGRAQYVLRDDDEQDKAIDFG